MLVNVNINIFLFNYGGRSDCVISVECRSNMWPCADGRQCVYSWDRCDGRTECSDGSDEEDCMLLLYLLALKNNCMLYYYTS